jgi:hypothetical protein
MKSRRISCPEPTDGVRFRAHNAKTGEVYESGDLALLLRRIVGIGLSCVPNDSWTLSREDEAT